MNQKPNWKKLRNGELSWSIFKFRADMLRRMRTFFDRRGFLEIEAPMLTPFPSLDNNIASVSCRIHTPDNRSHIRYLHTSPEHAMKKLIAAFSGNIYFLGKVFRDKESTKLHNPEYTMAEWYRMHSNYQGIMRDTENLVCDLAQNLFHQMKFTYQTQSIDLTPPWSVKSVSELFDEAFRLKSFELSDPEALRYSADRHNIHYAPDDDWETLFHRLFMDKIEPALGRKKPVFVADYPIQMGLMARRKTDEKQFVERVELYIGGLELANGYSELVDPEEQYIRFSKQRKQTPETETRPLDDELIQALKAGMPPCSGMALGVDRLLMFFLNKSQIRDVLLFPF